MSQTQGVQSHPVDLANVPVEQTLTAGMESEALNRAQYAGPSVGQRLCAGREARGWTIDEVAVKLKLGPDQIVALESDELSRMHCNAIARGFIRNYARLLGLDAAELMSALDQNVTLRQNAIAVPGSIDVPVSAGRRNYFWIVASLLLLFAVAAAYLFLPSDFVQTTISSFKDRFGEAAVQQASPSETRMVSEEPSTPISTMPDASAGAISAPVIIAPGAASSMASPPADENVTSVSAPVAGDFANAEDNVLKFSFAQSSWVEVKDRNGKVIFSQLNPPDSQREVKGQPPFSLLIGNAGNVSLSYRGKPVDLSRRSRDGVARVTVE